MSPFKLYLLLLFLVFLPFSHPILGQFRSIRGTVQDSHSEERVPFASVSFKGSTVGKLTDSSGTFSFSLDQWPSDTLEITCVGYQPFYYIIDQTRETITV